MLPCAWSARPQVAGEVVRQAGRANAGVLVDSWHYFRGVADPKQLRAIPAERIVGLQINDVAAEVVGTLREDTMWRRLLPARGRSTDLLDPHLDEIGVRLPYAIEVVSDAQTALPLDEAARHSFEATTAVLKKARGR